MRMNFIQIWTLGANDLPGETTGKNGTFLQEHPAINSQLNSQEFRFGDKQGENIQYEKKIPVSNSSTSVIWLSYQ